MEYVEPSRCCDADAAEEDSTGLVTEGFVRLGEEVDIGDWSWVIATGGGGAVIKGEGCVGSGVVVCGWVEDEMTEGVEVWVTACATAAYCIGGSCGGRGAGALTTFDRDCEKLIFDTGFAAKYSTLSAAQHLGKLLTYYLLIVLM